MLFRSVSQSRYISCIVVVVNCTINQSNFAFADSAAAFLPLIPVHKLLWRDATTRTSFCQSPRVFFAVFGHPMWVVFRPVFVSTVKTSIAVTLVQMRHLTAATTERRQRLCLATISTSFSRFSHDTRHRVLYIVWLTVGFYGRSTGLLLCLAPPET